jgi:hypothetical protein
MSNKNLDLKFDVLGIISLVLTFISILFSLKLSIENTILSVGVFLIIIATYLFIVIRNNIYEHAKEIEKINEKINIYRNISDLNAKVELLMNLKMGKRGNGDFVEIIIRIIQIAAIIFAGYIILKALGVVV